MKNRNYIARFSPTRILASVLKLMVIPAISVCLALTVALTVQAGRYSVDIQDIDIREFAGMVSKLTGNTYILDQRLSGKLNIRSQKQLSDDELINLFITELKLKGFALVAISDGTWKVVPDQKARVSANSIHGDRNPENVPFDQLVTRIIHMNNVNAAQMVPVLRPLIDKKTGYLFSYPPSNSLIIVDGQGNTSHIADMAKRLDQQGGKELELMCLRNADADDISGSLGKLMSGSSQKGGNPADIPIFVPDRRTNCVLVKASAETMVNVRDVIGQLDNEIGRDSRVRVFYLKYAKSDSVLKVLQGIAKGSKS